MRHQIPSVLGQSLHLVSTTTALLLVKFSEKAEGKETRTTMHSPTATSVRSKLTKQGSCLLNKDTHCWHTKLAICLGNDLGHCERILEFKFLSYGGNHVTQRFLLFLCWRCWRCWRCRGRRCQSRCHDW